MRPTSDAAHHSVAEADAAHNLADDSDKVIKATGRGGLGKGREGGGDRDGAGGWGCSAALPPLTPFATVAPLRNPTPLRVDPRGSASPGTVSPVGNCNCRWWGE